MRKHILILTGILLFIGANQSCTTRTTSAEVREEVSVQEVSIAKNIGPDVFKAGITERKDAILLDVRTPQELDEGFLEGAINIDFNSSDFMMQLEKLDKTKAVYVYCRSGGRSGMAMDAMKDMGFAEVYNLQGGIISWEQTGHATIIK